MRYVAIVVLFAAAIVIAAAQDLGPPPSSDPTPVAFEVASVKPNNTGAPGGSFVMPPGRFTATNISLKVLITNAYQLSFFQVVGGPGWVSTDRFDIAAKAPDGAPPGQTRAMVRTLLEERFKLGVHMETQDTPIYMATLANSLRTYAGREVVDRTGLTGEFDFELQFAALPTTSAADGGVPVAPLDDAASVFTALQEQLGLKLESTRGPVELMIIDSAERPIPD